MTPEQAHSVSAPGRGFEFQAWYYEDEFSEDDPYHEMFPAIELDPEKREAILPSEY